MCTGNLGLEHERLELGNLGLKLRRGHSLLDGIGVRDTSLCILDRIPTAGLDRLVGGLDIVEDTCDKRKISFMKDIIYKLSSFSVRLEQHSENGAQMWKNKDRKGKMGRMILTKVTHDLLDHFPFIKEVLALLLMAGKGNFEISLGLLVGGLPLFVLGLRKLAAFASIFHLLHSKAVVGLRLKP